VHDVCDSVLANEEVKRGRAVPQIKGSPRRRDHSMPVSKPSDKPASEKSSATCYQYSLIAFAIPCSIGARFEGIANGVNNLQLHCALACSLHDTAKRLVKPNLLHDAQCASGNGIAPRNAKIAANHNALPLAQVENNGIEQPKHYIRTVAFLVDKLANVNWNAVSLGKLIAWSSSEASCDPANHVDLIADVGTWRSLSDRR
jgi:hypothetical protein